jgi:hypothetical protein
MCAAYNAGGVDGSLDDLEHWDAFVATLRGAIADEMTVTELLHKAFQLLDEAATEIGRSEFSDELKEIIP